MRPRSRSFAFPLYMLASILAGCADQTAPTYRVQNAYGDLSIIFPNLIALTRVASGPQPVAGDQPPPPPDVGDDSTTTGDDWVTYSWPSTISAHWTDAGFTSSNAYVQTYMHYYATDATESATMVLRYNGAILISPPPATSLQSDYVPVSRDLFASTSIGIYNACGFAVDGYGVHTAKQVFGGSTWGTTTVSDQHGAAQAACAPGGGGGDGGDGGGGGGGDSYFVTQCTSYDYFDSYGNYLYSSEPVCETVQVT